MAEKCIAVLTSGGDAPGMNAAVRAVARQSYAAGVPVLGIERGYQGLFDEAFVPLGVGDVGGILDRGGTFLGTAREERMYSEEGIDAAAEVLRRHNVTGLIVVGGDGSFRGAEAIGARGINVMGAPATIDNDVGGTDTCIGFDTALNTIADAVSKVRDTASAHERTFVIEVMGRRSGMIALYSGLASGADVILVPEVPWEIGDVCRRVTKGMDRGKKHSIVVVAEGAGHGMKIAEQLSQMCGQEVRGVVLGHVQRGGAPSAFDRILASRMGAASVEALLGGKTGMMVGLRNAQMHLSPMSVGYTQSIPLPEELMDVARVLAQ